LLRYRRRFSRLASRLWPTETPNMGWFVTNTR